MPAGSLALLDKMIVSYARRLVSQVLRVALLAVVVRAVKAQATVTGTVYDSLRTNAPMKGATVVIPELPRYTSTDARGRFQMDSIPAGRYTITFLHPALDSLDIAAEVRPIEIPARGSVNARLATPSPAAAYARLCPSGRDVTTGVLIGHVRDVDDAAPIAGAVVTAGWMEYALEHGKMRGSEVRVNAITNAAGVYLLCGVPGDVSFDVYALTGGFAAGPVSVAPDAHLLERLNLAVSRRDSAALLAASSVVDTARRGVPILAQPGSATVSGRIRSADGGRVPSALVGVAGSGLAMRTDTTGAFRLTRVPAGTRSVTVRAIGVAPASLVLDLASGATLDTVVIVDRRAQTLREVTVLADGRARPDRTGFTERTRTGQGHYLSDEQIEKRPTPDLFGQWLRMPGLIEMIDRAGVRHLLMRGGNGLSNLRFCYPNFYLDGVYYPLDVGLDPYNSILSFARVGGTKGIEVYLGSGTIPPAFDRSSFTGCGSIVIWTK